ncbi:MAG: hypothetical protein O3A46_13975 [Candidatus Poribacteria bacterium]|nr:hypothetical protein [Candidatus Poribacteria bacterium]
MTHPIFDGLPNSLRRARTLLWSLPLTTVFLVGCSVGIGTIEPDDVALAIRQAEASIAQAKNSNLTISARPSLTQAEVKLAEAKRALDDKEGLIAFQAAQEAQLQAQNAMMLSSQATSFQKLLTEESKQYEAALSRAKLESEQNRDSARQIQDDLLALRREVENVRRDSSLILQDRAPVGWKPTFKPRENRCVH